MDLRVLFDQNNDLPENYAGKLGLIGSIIGTIGDAVSTIGAVIDLEQSLESNDQAAQNPQDNKKQEESLPTIETTTSLPPNFGAQVGILGSLIVTIGDVISTMATAAQLEQDVIDSRQEEQEKKEQEKELEEMKEQMNSLQKEIKSLQRINTIMQQDILFLQRVTGIRF